MHKYDVGYVKICRRNTTANTETFTEKQLGCNFALHFTSYSSINFPKFRPIQKQ